MSQENESAATPPSPEPSAPPASIAPPTSATVSRRPSLKALAEKAATMPQPRPSLTSVPPPSRQSVPPASTVTPRPALSSRPSAPAASDDEGVINLNPSSPAPAPAPSRPAAAAAPASSPTLASPPAAAAAAAPAAPVAAPAAPAAAEAKPAGAEVIPLAAAAAKAPEAKKGNTGMIAGGVIALLGLAAAFALMQKNNAPAPAATTPETKPAVVAEVKPTPKPEAPPPAATQAAEPAATAAPAPEPEKVAAAPTSTAVAPAAPANTGAATAAPKEANDSKLAAATKPAPTSTSKPGDLASEMAKAVGGADTNKAAQGTPEPAAGGTKNQNVPEQPSQGSVQAAIGGVMGGAKACVAGADDVSRAQITFSSGGTVSSVSVTGWAAANGKTGCVKSALSGAKVGPFSRPSFTVGTTIRP